MLANVVILSISSGSSSEKSFIPNGSGGGREDGVGDTEGII